MFFPFRILNAIFLYIIRLQRGLKYLKGFIFPLYKTVITNTYFIPVIYIMSSSLDL